MGVEGAGLVSLGAPHDDAVLALLHDAAEHIRIGLFATGARLRSPLTSVMAPSTVQSLLLHLQQEFPKRSWYSVPSFLSISKVTLSTRVDGVHADAALEAGSRLLAQQALHLHLLHQILGALVQMAEAIDLFPVSDDVAVIRSAYCGS